MFYLAKLLDYLTLMPAVTWPFLIWKTCCISLRFLCDTWNQCYLRKGIRFMIQIELFLQNVNNAFPCFCGLDDLRNGNGRLCFSFLKLKLKRQIATAWTIYNDDDDYLIAISTAKRCSYSHPTQRSQNPIQPTYSSEALKPIYMKDRKSFKNSDNAM